MGKETVMSMMPLAVPFEAATLNPVMAMGAACVLTGVVGLYAMGIGAYGVRAVSGAIWGTAKASRRPKDHDQ